MIALPCGTINLDHILTDPNPDGAISIVHDNRDGRRPDDRDNMLRQASSHLSKRPLRREMPSRYEILGTEGAQGPHEAIYAWVVNDGPPCAVSDGSGSCGHDDLSFDGL